MKKFAIFYSILIFVFLLLSCSEETKIEEQKEPEIDKFAPLKNSSVIYIIGNDVIPYHYHSKDAYGDYAVYYQISGIESYDKHIEDSLKAVSSDSIKFFSTIRLAGHSSFYNRLYQLLIGRGGESIQLWDKSKSTWIALAKDRIGFNRDILYVDFVRDSLKLTNGFVGKISHKRFPDPLRRIYLEIERYENIFKFGSYEREKTGTEEITLYGPSKRNVSYICFDYETLMIIAKKLKKSIVPTKIPFLFKLV